MFSTKKIFKRPFRLIQQDRALNGVLAGLAYSMEKPVWIVRALFLLLGIVFGSIGLMLIVLYVIATYYVPKWENDPVDYKTLCE